MTQDAVGTVPSGAQAATRPARLGIVDCDVHPALRSVADLHPWLERRWREHLHRYGPRTPIPFTDSSPYPKAAPALSRADAWPPNGAPPGADLGFLRAQLLDAYNVDYGILHVLFPQGMDQRNQEFGIALCRAINEWLYHEWTQKEPRLKASLVVPGENAEAAVKEIEHWAGVADFAQVALVTHTIEPLGRRRYWPIYEAAAAHNLPIGLHTSGYNGYAVTGSGWCSYYVEEHHNVSLSQHALLTSLAIEGVLARLPSLRVVIVESGFAWMPPLCWRLDRQWARMRDEVPHVKRPPSEYIREQVWFTTQPMDEPENPDDLRDVIDWIGWDRLLFATDYPHWDFDNPETAFRIRMSDQERRMLFSDNARRLYGLT